MAHLLFWEKPGCGGNAKQKAWLVAAGHTLEVRDLLSWPWTPENLRPFLAGLPVADWFNRAAPRVKSGEVLPESFDADAALAQLVAEPLLIRRPLMQLDQRRVCGFDPATIDAWIGLREQDAARPRTNAEGCAAAATGSPTCAPR